MADEQVLENQLFQGDCLDILPKLKDCSVDLIVTSPPYADQRKDTYGGVHPDKYVECCTIGLDSSEKGTIFLREGVESGRQLNGSA